jgi:tetratricopeptide (TPR) repeat protein
VTFLVTSHDKNECGVDGADPPLGQESWSTERLPALLVRLASLFLDPVFGKRTLGMAQARAGQWDEAIRAFREVVTRDPQDGLARKNLGAALSQTGRLDDAREHLKAAVVLLPSDAEAWLNLAINLERSGEMAEAEIAYQQVMSLAPGSQLSETAELGRNRITTANFRKTGGDFNPDALTYCGEALRKFEDMPKAEVQRISLEIGMLGTKGLSVNDPSGKYTLHSLPGNFSGLHLLCIQYVGFKIIDPSVDIGFDIAAEYEEARRLHGGSSSPL